MANVTKSNCFSWDRPLGSSKFLCDVHFSQGNVGEVSWVWETLFRHLGIIYFSHHQPWVFWEIFLFRFGEYLFLVRREGILQVGVFCMCYIFLEKIIWIFESFIFFSVSFLEDWNQGQVFIRVRYPCKVQCIEPCLLHSFLLLTPFMWVY